MSVLAKFKVVKSIAITSPIAVGPSTFITKNSSSVTIRASYERIKRPAVISPVPVATQDTILFSTAMMGVEGLVSSI